MNLRTLPQVLGLITLALGAPAMAAAPPAAVAQPVALLGVEMLLPHLAGPAPFARPLGVALGLAQQEAWIRTALEALTPIAARGAPTLATLTRDFAAVADQAIQGELGLEGAGTLGRIAASTMRLGTGLGAGVGAGLGAGLATTGLSSTATALLAATRDASARLSEGDLGGADAALAGLDGTAGAAFAAWRAAARDRLHLDASAALLASLVAARLGQQR